MRVLFGRSLRLCQMSVGCCDTREVDANLLSPASLRTHGLMLRKRLNERDPASRRRLNRALLSFCASLPGVRFVTMRDVALGASGAPAM